MKLTEAILTAPKQIEYRERDMPPLTGSQVLVKVSMCGVCSTEIPVWMGKTQGARGASKRYYKFPSRLGHEPSGYVEDIGPEVKKFKPGDAVTGMANADSRSHFATHVIEEEESWLKIPEGFKPEEVLGEPLGCIENIIQHIVPDYVGGDILVVGDGFMSLVLLRVYPYKKDKLKLLGHHNNRLNLVPGGCLAFNGLEMDAYETLKIQNDGYDIALDFTGKMAGLQLAASLCKPKVSTPLLRCAVYGDEPYALGHYEVNRGVVPIPCYPAQSGDFPRDLRNGVTPKTIRQSRELITHSYKLEELGKAFEDAMGRRDGYIKGVVSL